ncbi:MAG: Zn-ribbon domain-containing OB-fold protein [Syntrophobacterales bacterium]|nr:Zn-ribbon domain-containing OB-fold protein [Syntrophobacterales bacterium]
MVRPEQLIIASGDAVQPFAYSVGMHGSRFFTEIRDNCRFMAVRCPRCKKVYIPPRAVCGDCFVEMKEWVEVGPQGVIGTFTIIRFAFLDPETGRQKPVPYGYGFIKLDGADTLFQHYISVEEEKRLRIGARVAPVFSRERKGSIRDIEYFKVTD